MDNSFEKKSELNKLLDNESKKLLDLKIELSPYHIKDTIVASKR